MQSFEEQHDATVIKDYDYASLALGLHEAPFHSLVERQMGSNDSSFTNSFLFLIHFFSSSSLGCKCFLEMLTSILTPTFEYFPLLFNFVRSKGMFLASKSEMINWRWCFWMFLKNKFHWGIEDTWLGRHMSSSQWSEIVWSALSGW